MSFIPQCHPEPGTGNHTDWYFRSAPKKTPVSANLRPAGQPEKISDAAAIAAIREAVTRLPKRDAKDFNLIQLEKRKAYPRSYEYWTAGEEQLLKQASALLTDTFALSALFGRQPSVIEYKLSAIQGV
jgi:hypothetical protein